MKQADAPDAVVPMDDAVIGKPSDEEQEKNQQAAVVKKNSLFLRFQQYCPTVAKFIEKHPKKLGLLAFVVLVLAFSWIAYSITDDENFLIPVWIIFSLAVGF